MTMTYGGAKPRPDGDWKACPACGTHGTLTRIVRWLGGTPERETTRCDRCEGDGWLPAPPWYRLPVKQWPAGGRL